MELDGLETLAAPLVVRHARRDDRTVIEMRGIDHGETFVVEVDVFPSLDSAHARRPRPPDRSRARSAVVKAVVQRVRAASVTVDGETVGAVGPGLCVLLGVAESDRPEDADRLARRIGALRVFENEEGRFDRSVRDVGGDVLVVSQFTLIAETRKGNRPSFSAAARPEAAEPLYERFCAALRGEGVRVATGRFGARMLVGIENDGPVTVIVET